MPEVLVRGPQLEGVPAIPVESKIPVSQLKFKVEKTITIDGEPVRRERPIGRPGLCIVTYDVKVTARPKQIGKTFEDAVRLAPFLTSADFQGNKPVVVATLSAYLLPAEEMSQDDDEIAMGLDCEDGDLYACMETCTNLVGGFDSPSKMQKRRYFKEYRSFSPMLEPVGFAFIRDLEIRLNKLSTPEWKVVGTELMTHFLGVLDKRKDDIGPVYVCPSASYSELRSDELTESEKQAEEQRMKQLFVAMEFAEVPDTVGDFSNDEPWMIKKVKP